VEKKRKGGQWKKMARAKGKQILEADGALLVHSGEKHNFETLVEEWGPIQVRKRQRMELENNTPRGDLGSAEVARQPRREQ
jgi:hypothetical protein